MTGLTVFGHLLPSPGPQYSPGFPDGFRPSRLRARTSTAEQKLSCTVMVTLTLVSSVSSRSSSPTFRFLLFIWYPVTCCRIAAKVLLVASWLAVAGSVRPAERPGPSPGHRQPGGH